MAIEGGERIGAQDRAPEQWAFEGCRLGKFARSENAMLHISITLYTQNFMAIFRLHLENQRCFICPVSHTGTTKGLCFTARPMRHKDTQLMIVCIAILHKLKVKVKNLWHFIQPNTPSSQEWEWQFPFFSSEHLLINREGTGKWFLLILLHLAIFDT